MCTGEIEGEGIAHQHSLLDRSAQSRLNACRHHWWARGDRASPHPGKSSRAVPRPSVALRCAACVHACMGCFHACVRACMLADRQQLWHGGHVRHRRGCRDDRRCSLVRALMRNRRCYWLGGHTHNAHKRRLRRGCNPHPILSPGPPQVIAWSLSRGSRAILPNGRRSRASHGISVSLVRWTAELVGPILRNI